MFHPLRAREIDSARGGTTREFVGDGTGHLRTPGLRGMPTAVRIGGLELPLTLEQRFPLHPDPSEKITITVPMIDVVRDHDGVPVLRRNQQSNDGYWQKGERIYVQGEWEDPPRPSSPENRSGVTVVRR